MPEFDPSAYGPVVAELLAEDRLNPLDPGTPNEAVLGRLEGLSPEDLFGGTDIADPDMAAACLAALWLHHDFLDTSHTLSQGIRTPTGSYWHLIMHRREPDFSNARYWVAQTGEHAIFGEVCEAARQIAAGEEPSHPDAEFLKTQPAWNPTAFVDLCEASHTGRAPCEDLCRRVQRREWQILFNYSHQHAV